MSLIVANLILTIHVHIVVDPTFGKIVNILHGNQCVHHLNPIGNMTVLYVLVEMDIRVMFLMPPPLVILKQMLVLLMSLIGLMM